MAAMNLLSIDFDYFFPRPPEGTAEAFQFYDWSHAETMLYIEAVWPMRAATFLNQGRPLPQVNDDWKTFWSRFDFAPHAKLFYGESHAKGAHPEVTERIDGQVWVYDAHHDCGYFATDSVAAAQRAKEWMAGRWRADDWLVYYGLRLGPSHLHVRYPTHRSAAFTEEPTPYFSTLDRAFDDGAHNRVRFHRVYLCRSGAWVPPWSDTAFDALVAAFPAKGATVDLGTVKRKFTLADAQAYADWLNQALKQA